MTSDWREKVGVAATMLLLLWALWFSILAYWSFNRPQHILSALGYTHYLKTFRNVVYINGTDNTVSIIFQLALAVGTISIFGALVWMKLRELRRISH